MSADDTPEPERGDKSVEPETESEIDAVSPDVRERLEGGADRAIDQFDEGLVDLLAWMLETETRARIYVTLRKDTEQTSEEIAESTGLYPSTVREALASLHDDGIVTRQKRQNAGAGNNPYEYSAIAPSELVGEIVDDIQDQLNRVFNLDRYITRSEDASDDDGDTEPVTITVTEHTADDGPDESETAEETDGDCQEIDIDEIVDIDDGNGSGETDDSDDTDER